MCAISFFFFRAFQKNWIAIESHDLKFKAHFAFMSFASMMLSYLLTSYAWFLTINRLSENNKMTFPETIAVVNTSGLTKYIPGKIWSYALQMYWLVKSGFPKSLILYVNALNIFVSLISATMLGLVFLVFSPGNIPLSIILPFLLFVLIFDGAVISFGPKLFNRFILLVNKFFNRDIQYYNTPTNLFVCLHAVHSASAFCFGMGAYYLCIGIGLDVSHGRMFLVMSALMISDAIGFLIFIVPGGLGVREGIMYFMLQGASTGALSLILPIATRIVSMLVDVCLGTLGFVLLKRLHNKHT